MCVCVCTCVKIWVCVYLQGLVGGLNAPTNATINTHIKINHQTAELSVAVRQVENAPGEGNAGSPAYQVNICLFYIHVNRQTFSIAPGSG